MPPPVLLLVFNRPDLTEQVMAKLRTVEPPKLFVGADGPRSNHPEDEKRCEEARRVATQVDWDCEVHTLFRDKNLGCREAISSAITWFFEHVEAGIILEDDCVPAESFFPFCEALLEQYQSDDRVVMVSGNNPLSPWRDSEQDYHFSYYGGIWGWATWRKEWQLYKEASKVNTPATIRRVLSNVLVDSEHVELRTNSVRKAINGDLDSWGFQWFWARILQSKLSIVSSRNLISNVGFGETSTHTTDESNPKANTPLETVSLPLSGPVGMYPDREYDKKWFRMTQQYNNRGIGDEIFGFLLRQKGRVEELLGTKI